MAKRPTQMTILEPFTPRQWYTVNKDCVSIFPTLDKRNGETDAEALYNPLLGSMYDSIDSPNPGLNIIYKDIFSSAVTGDLLLARTGNSTFTVAAGRAIVNNVYMESNETITIDLTSSLSYLDSTAFNDTTGTSPNSTYVVLLGVFDSTSADVAVISVANYETWLADREAAGLTTTYVILGFIHTDINGYIDSTNGVSYEYDIYNRSPYSFENLIDYDPLNCGVIRSNDSTSAPTVDPVWADDWDYSSEETPLEITP